MNRPSHWRADLQEYDFEIQHIPGKINTPVDVLSRPPDADQGKTDNQGVTLLPPSKFINATRTSMTSSIVIFKTINESS